jgi:hypothetical protein
VVREVRFDDGAPWASLELQDDDTVALLGAQASDGERTIEVVLGLRAQLRGRSGQGPEPSGP